MAQLITLPDSKVSKWQIHVYGKVNQAIATLAENNGLQLYTFEWTANAKRVGRTKETAYLLRPDGHIAIAVDLKNAQGYRTISPSMTFD